MNRLDGAADMAAPISDPEKVVSADRRDDGFGLELVEWFARAFQRTFSEQAVAIRLPEHADMTSPAMIARALSCVGLKSRLVLRDPKAIDRIVLPCVLFRKSGAPLVLVALGPKGKTASIVDLAEGDLEQEVRMRTLRRAIRPEVLLVTLADDRSNSRLSPETVNITQGKGHWFWKPVLANWANWFQILIAALVLNTLSLALPLFVMNVYDKVIPNLAFVTLWTLAFGVAIALGFDLILRIMRANILENIGRRVDLKVAS